MKRHFGVICILLCSIVLLSGCNNIYKALSDGTEKVLHTASDLVGDKSKNAILNAFENFNETAGSTLLTQEKSLQGKRTNGEDDYTGEYVADYEKYSGTEIVFGGTTIERDSGNTLSVHCSLEITSGEAIVFQRNGDNDPIGILGITNEYSGTIEVGNGGSYIGIYAENFTGSIEIKIE